MYLLYSFIAQIISLSAEIKGSFLVTPLLVLLWAAVVVPATFYNSEGLWPASSLLSGPSGKGATHFKASKLLWKKAGLLRKVLG